MSVHHGGPAFPGAFHNGSDVNVTAPDGQIVPPNCPSFAPGMSLRQFFAAHAPPEPQPWFRPVMAKERPKALRAADAYPGDQPLNAREIGDWERDLHKETLLQWPMAWADEMITRSSR